LSERYYSGSLRIFVHNFPGLFLKLYIFWKCHGIENLKSDGYIWVVIFMSAILDFKMAAMKIDIFNLSLLLLCIETSSKNQNMPF